MYTLIEIPSKVGVPTFEIDKGGAWLATMTEKQKRNWEKKRANGKQGPRVLWSYVSNDEFAGYYVAASQDQSHVAVVLQQKTSVSLTTIPNGRSLPSFFGTYPERQSRDQSHNGMSALSRVLPQRKFEADTGTEDATRSLAFSILCQFKDRDRGLFGRQVGLTGDDLHLPVQSPTVHPGVKACPIGGQCQ